MFSLTYEFGELSLLKIGPAEACIYATGRAEIEFAAPSYWSVSEIEISTVTPIKGGGWVEARTYLDASGPLYPLIVAALERDADRITEWIKTEFAGGALWGASPRAQHGCHVGHCQREDRA